MLSARHSSVRKIRARASRVNRHLKPAWLRYANALTYLLVAALSLPLLAFSGYFSYTIAGAVLENLPDPQELVLGTIPDDTIVYDSTGTVELADLHPAGYFHYYRPIDMIAKNLVQATVATEDTNFYTEPGVDLNGTIRAALTNYRSGQTVQGGSTITQQLVKLRLVGSQVTIERKIREAILAYRVSQTYSKDQIMEMYLNTIFYGNSSYGIQAATQDYFHINADKLDLAQASMLAGIPQNPSRNSPLVNWDGAKARQQIVLDAMLKQGYITASQEEKAYAEDLSPPKHMFYAQEHILYPDFIGYIISELKQFYGSDIPFTGGLHVISTLNIGLQTIAQRDVNKGVALSRRYNNTDGALVAIDPHNGEILAMVGAADGAPGSDYNMAVWPPRNPGSSMKIYTYTAAIASGKYTMVSNIADAPFCDGNYCPHNYEGGYIGVCQLQVCMGNSRNIPAVKVELGTGIAAVANMARQMGAPPWTPHAGAGGTTRYTSDDPLSSYTAPMTLGSYGETPLQMATGVSVFASQGVLHPPTSIVNVHSYKGELIYQLDPQLSAKRILDPRVAFIMEQIMSNDANRARIFGLHSSLVIPNHTVGVKTGTSDDFGDAWTLGYTPAIAVAVWTGNTDWRHKMNNDSIFVAAPLWHMFMVDSLNYLQRPNEWYSEPAGLNNVNIRGQMAYFLPGTGPNTNGPVH